MSIKGWMKKTVYLIHIELKAHLKVMRSPNSV